MARRTSLDTSCDVIVRWFEDNQTTATAKDLESELNISHSTMWHALRFLEDRGTLRAVNPNQRRNVLWEFTGQSSKMPMVKDTETNSFIPITVIWKAFAAFAKNSPEKFMAKYPKQLAFVAVTRYFHAAVQAQMNDMDNARQTMAGARRVLFQARKIAVQDLELIDRLLSDPKLNVNNPRSLIPILLEDKQYPVDVYKMWNEESQYLIKMVGNKA